MSLDVRLDEYDIADSEMTLLGEFTKQLFKEHKEWIRDDWKGGNLKLLDYACGTGLASQVCANLRHTSFG